MNAVLQKPVQNLRSRISVSITDELSPADLNDLCDATDSAIEAGGGFGWVKPPSRDVLERYWRGVLVVPERHLIVARMDGVICGASQLIVPTRHNEATSFQANLLATFVSPFGRGAGAGRRLVETAEQLALEMGYKVLTLDVRETQAAAIAMFENMGFKRWGTNPSYAMVQGRMIAGHYYNKQLAPLAHMAAVE
jgi:ribosomal protein S18 acetylase RimI-like enzyme